MGNENERKRNPADNRERRMGHPFDDPKTGGEEQTVGLTNDRGFGDTRGATSNSVGTGGIIGGSAEFLTGGEESTGEAATPETSGEQEQRAERSDRGDE